MGWLDRFTNPVVRPLGDDRYALTLAEEPRRAVDSLLADLAELLGTDSPALVRLFPPPYGDDDERNQGWAALAGAELVERQLATIELVRATIDRDELTGDELDAWMRALNSLRLVLGTALDVDESHTPPPPGDPTEATFATYELLGYLLEHVVRARG